MRTAPLFVLLGLLTLAGCQKTFDTPDQAETPVAESPGDLPVLLRDRSPLAMEAIVSGRLTRRGACLYLEYAQGLYALVLWGDSEVQIARLDEDGWLVDNSTTSQRFREGDMILGGGGFYPEAADPSGLTEDAVPQECDGPAVQIYAVKKFDPAAPDGAVTAPVSPKPRISQRSPLLDEAFAQQPSGFVGPRRSIPDVAGALEAMFIYILQDYRSDQSHKCLRDADPALIGALERRFGELQPAEACGDRNGRVVLLTNGEAAISMFAQVDCSRQAKLGFCAGAAGAAWGNLGAQAQAYRLRRQSGGWEIERLGIGVIS